MSWNQILTHQVSVREATDIAVICSILGAAVLHKYSFLFLPLLGLALVGAAQLAALDWS